MSIAAELENLNRWAYVCWSRSSNTHTRASPGRNRGDQDRL